MEPAAGELRPSKRVHVAKAAPPVLEIGLEEEGNLAGAAMAVFDPLRQLPEPSPRSLLPLQASSLGELRGERFVASNMAGAEHGGGGIEIVGRQRQRLLHRRDAVAEVQTFVPDGVPDAFCHRGGVPTTLVNEHDVDVAVRAQLGSAVPADRDQSQATGVVTDGLAQQLSQPGVHPAGMGCAPRRAKAAVVGQQGVSREGHGGRVSRVNG